MTGIDANVLVRYLVQDDPLQSRKANEVFENRLAVENPGFISVVAMAETVWVLKRAYKFPDHEIATAIERILQMEILVVENEQQVFTAMIVLKSGTNLFADALIGALAENAGCSRTLTFDRKVSRLPNFELL